MTPYRYFRQAYRLNNLIDSDLEELEDLKQKAYCISSPSLEQHYNPNRSTEAPYEHTLQNIWDLNEEINAEIDKYVDLKRQIRSVLSGLSENEERLAIRYRIMDGMTWDEVSAKLDTSEKTARRWCLDGLDKVVLPENMIII